MSDKPADATSLPPGDYAIVELFGHTTLVGRCAEVERFGAKMLAIETLFDGALLPEVFHGGAAIYRFTPCSPAVAWERQPRQGYHLPPAIRAIVPNTLLPPDSPMEFPDDGIITVGRRPPLDEDDDD